MKTLGSALAVVGWVSFAFSGFSLPANAQAAANGAAEASRVELPDSPSVVIARAQEPAQNQSQPAQATPQTPSQNPNPDQGQPAQRTEKPVGTAVAGAPNARGVAAAQPSGVAIAPAKQRRVRTLVLRMGAIAGVGIAIGSVVALTQATPSKPPGAH